jgi:hypothetical protein
MGVVGAVKRPGRLFALLNLFPKTEFRFWPLPTLIDQAVLARHPMVHV